MDLENRSVSRGVVLKDQVERLSGRITRMGVEDTSNRMLGVSVRGVDEDGDYFGEVHAVTSWEGKKRYYVLWEYNKYDESFYSYVEIQMLRVKEKTMRRAPRRSGGVPDLVGTPKSDVSGWGMEPDFDMSDCIHLRENKRPKFTKNKKGRVSLTPYGRAATGLIP